MYMLNRSQTCTSHLLSSVTGVKFEIFIHSQNMKVLSIRHGRAISNNAILEYTAGWKKTSIQTRSLGF